MWNLFSASVLTIWKAKSKDLYVRTCPKALLPGPNERFLIPKLLMRNIMVVIGLRQLR